MNILLLISVFCIATCGLVYELISSALASYLLGDSVTQFSTVIGVYLFSMGIGSYLSKHIHRRYLQTFVKVEILIGAVGGSSAALLFGLFSYVGSFRVLLYSLIMIIGTLVGLEIPLLMRILKHEFDFKDLVSQVFTFDYVGALIASLLFPLVLVPKLGLVRSSFLFGVINVLVAYTTLHLFHLKIEWAKTLKTASVVVLIGLGLGFAYSDKIVNFSEEASYGDRVIYAKYTPYQRIVLTRSAEDFRLYLSGHLQFSSRDEYRYHEALVHPGLQFVSSHAKHVLVMGGGDGMAVREILKYPGVENVTLVDLDPAMTQLFKEQPLLTQLNQNSFNSPRVKIINTDAFVWLKNNRDQFDFIVLDFPDPTNYSVGKLYTTSFLRLLHSALSPHGAVVMQSTSPFFARKSFWCIDKTFQEVGFQTTPYHAYVPAFGEWGFVLATLDEFTPPDEFLPGLKFMNPEVLQQMLTFPPDMRPIDTDVNRLNNQILVRYYEGEWSEYAR